MGRGGRCNWRNDRFGGESTGGGGKVRRIGGIKESNDGGMEEER